MVVGRWDKGSRWRDRGRSSATAGEGVLDGLGTRKRGGVVRRAGEFFGEKSLFRKSVSLNE